MYLVQRRFRWFDCDYLKSKGNATANSQSPNAAAWQRLLCRGPSVHGGLWGCRLQLMVLLNLQVESSIFNTTFAACLIFIYYSVIAMSKTDFMQALLTDGKKPLTAVEKIPIIAQGAVSNRAKETLNLVRSSILIFPCNQVLIHILSG